MNTYGIQKKVTGDFETTLAQVKAELAKEGFGVLTEINVTETLKKKLNVDYTKYVILGACHPKSAYQVLQKEPSIGLLLPCNVIVYQTGNTITVEAIRPTVAMEIVDNPEIAQIAKEIEGKLQHVVENVSGQE